MSDILNILIEALSFIGFLFLLILTCIILRYIYDCIIKIIQNKQDKKRLAFEIKQEKIKEQQRLNSLVDFLTLQNSVPNVEPNQALIDACKW